LHYFISCSYHINKIHLCKLTKVALVNFSVHITLTKLKFKIFLDILGKILYSAVDILGKKTVDILGMDQLCVRRNGFGLVDGV
jgi:hypothetical protein